MSNHSFPYFHRWAGVPLVSVVLMLAGCASATLAARVTSFQQWPADAQGQSYRFAAAEASQNNNLEYQTYQDMVRAGIGVTGLVEAQGSVKPRFEVSFKYGSTQTQIMVRQPYTPYFYGGYRYGGYRPDPIWGPGWGPNWVDVPAVVYRNSLSLEIHDTNHDGAEVYRSTAYIITERDDLLGTMPYLVQAIFDSFPGNNSSERRIDYPLNH
jgi:hypothetical protein